MLLSLFFLAFVRVPRNDHVSKSDLERSDVAAAVDVNEGTALLSAGRKTTYATSTVDEDEIER